MRLTSVFLQASLLTWVHGTPTCNQLTFQVSATANNLVLHPSLNLSSLTAKTYQDLANSPKQAVSGLYNIAARFCEPESKNLQRSKTIQLLVHGVTYTKDYWSGLGPPGQGYDDNKYSYVEFASKQGYPTLAFDRICSGDSDKPNGLLACQLPLNAEILYQIIQHLRTTNIAGRRTFDTVLPVCHSEGATICQLLMQTQPDTPVGAYVLNGYSQKLLLGAPGSYLAGSFLPAAIAKPDQFGSLLLDPTYQVATSAAGARGVFYAGDYDAGLAAYDFAHTHPLTLGELASAPLSQLRCPGYKGRIFLVNGDKDVIFCSVLPTDPLLGNGGNCGSGDTSVTAQTKAVFPNADFEYYQVPNVGHDTGLHLSAQLSFSKIHEYLAKQGF